MRALQHRGVGKVTTLGGPFGVEVLEKLPLYVGPAAHTPTGHFSTEALEKPNVFEFSI